MNSKEIIKILKQNGFYEKSQNGSHLKLTNGEKILTVPVHGSKDVGIGLVKAIEKQSGVKLR